jgi:hypothetical protein
MKEMIKEYLWTLYRVAKIRKNNNYAYLPYGLEYQRADAHNKLFKEGILSFVKARDDWSEDDIYQRTKDIFANLDKVFALYNAFPLDLTNPEIIHILTLDLNRFFCRSEVKMFLEGKTNYIKGVIETENN